MKEFKQIKNLDATVRIPGSKSYTQRALIIASLAEGKSFLRNFLISEDTKYLMDAKEAGCSTITGVSMFVHQGAEQIKIWTGLQPPIEFMKKVVLEKLKDETS